MANNLGGNQSRRRVGEITGDMLGGSSPVSVLQRQMGRLFEDFFPIFEERAPFLKDLGKGFSPRVSVQDDRNQVIVSAELPGMEEKEIEITLAENILTIRGEKRSESEKSEGGTYYTERSFGVFERVLPLTVEVEDDKVDASFKNGILTIRMPKKAASVQTTKKISVRAG